MAKVVPCKLEISSNPMMFDGVVGSTGRTRTSETTTDEQRQRQRQG